MIEVVGVKFKVVGRIYYFAVRDKEIKLGDNLIVETIRGVEFGKVVLDKKLIDEEELNIPIGEIIRVATDEDVKKHEENKRKQVIAFGICLKKIEKHGLKMKLVDAEYTFDNNKILFYFTADGRIDFRELVKDLAAIFKTRIELRQIGIRDEAKMVGGLGICGRVLCCRGFLGDFQPVSIKMAKEQGLSLNPTKISGTCGRLMCCLKYEQDAYEDLNSRVPRVGSIVKTDDGQGTVILVNLLKEKVRVKFENKDGNGAEVRDYEVKDIVIIENASEQEEIEDIDIEKLRELED